MNALPDADEGFGRHTSSLHVESTPSFGFVFFFAKAACVIFLFGFSFARFWIVLFSPINNKMFLLVHLTLNVGQLCILCTYYNFKCPFFFSS